MQKWTHYVNWYSNLTKDQRDKIIDTPSHRIQKAVRHLGNAIVRRGNKREHSIRELFEIYLDIQPEYFSSSSVNLWRYWLFRCPSWQENPNISYTTLHDSLCKGQDVCREEWESFRDFLEEWQRVPGLTIGRKRGIAREIQKLNSALECEE